MAQHTLAGEQSLRFFSSVRGQLVMRFLVIGVLPLILLGALAYLGASGALQNSVQSGLLALAEAKTQEVQLWLADVRNITETLAAMPEVSGRAATVGGGRYGLEALQSFGPGTLLYEEAYESARDASLAFADNFVRVDAVMIAGQDGTILISTLEGLETGGDIRDLGTVPFDELRDTDYVVTPVSHSAVDDQIILVAATAVRNSAGEFVGVVAIRTIIQTLDDIMENRAGLGETGETYLVESDGRLMVTQSRFIEERTALVQAVDTYAVQQTLDGVTNGTAEYDDYRGEPIVGAWQYIPEMDWVLLAEQDVAEAYAPVNDLAGLMALIVIVTAGVIAVATYLVARTISRPIMIVTDAAVRIASGALDERANVRAKNEIGVLARSFNSMTENLQVMMETERAQRDYLENTVSSYMSFVQRVAEGDLTARLQLNGSGDADDLHRLGLNLNSMVDNLREIAGQTRQMATALSSAAAEILAATTQQIASTTEQEAAVTQTMTTVEEVIATVLQTAERAENVADTSQQSVKVSRAGEQAVVESTSGMQMVRRRVEDIAETILALSGRTQQIGEIIDTVNEIADQSKLLALNASIEAARAGEEGKGFAVVAMEVRQLAEQSREATARVGDILGEIQQATNAAVMVTEEGSKGAESGMTLVERAGEAIRYLAGLLEEAAQAAQQIAASTQQQSSGMEQLAAAMRSIQQASTQAASSTRQAEKSAQDLAEMARQMEETAARYKV